MAQQKQTLGKAIDDVVQALEPLEISARKTALVAVCSHLQIELENISESEISPQNLTTTDPSPTPPNQPTSPSPKPSKANIDIRTLKEQKKPASAKQMACLVAYYLQEHATKEERKETVSTSDLEKYFKQAGFKLPQRMAQVLPDAKNSGYFDSGTRGEYKLNAVGYNLIVHNLPPKTSGE